MLFNMDLFLTIVMFLTEEIFKFVKIQFKRSFFFKFKFLNVHLLVFVVAAVFDIFIQ